MTNNRSERSQTHIVQLFAESKWKVFLVAPTGENPLEWVTDGCYLYLSPFFSCYPFTDLARVNEIELTTGVWTDSTGEDST